MYSKTTFSTNKQVFAAGAQVLMNVNVRVEGGPEEQPPLGPGLLLLLSDLK